MRLFSRKVLPHEEIRTPGIHTILEPLEIIQHLVPLEAAPRLPGPEPAALLGENGAHDVAPAADAADADGAVVQLVDGEVLADAPAEMAQQSGERT